MLYKKILIIQTAFLGDVVMSTPLIRAAREEFPESVIDVLTIPSTGIVFKHCPHVNQVLFFDKRKFFRKAISFIKLIFELRKGKYDLAISIQSSLTSSFLMMLGKIPERVGYRRQKFLTRSVTHEKGLHIRERCISLMKLFSDREFDLQTEIYWSHQEEDRAEQIIEKYRNRKQYLVGMAPGSVWNTKRWLADYYAMLLKQLEQTGVQVIMIGGGEDRLLCDQILKEATAKSAVNLAGELSILESAAVISRLNLMITNDSAPLHLANAVQTDVIAFFGPTVRRFGCYPYRPNDQMLEVDLYCRPCSKHGGRKCPEKHFRCMKEIKPELAFDVVMSHLKGKDNER